MPRDLLEGKQPITGAFGPNGERDLIADYEKNQGRRVDPSVPEAQPAAGISGALGEVGKMLYDLPTQTMGAFAKAYEGKDPFGETNYADELIAAAQQRSQERAEEPGGDQPVMFGLTRQDFRDTGSSLGFTAANAAAGLATGIPVGLANPAAGYVAGGFASGAAAHQMAANDFLRATIEAEDAEAIKSTGKGLTQEQKVARQEELSKLANEYGLWEAIPEAVGNVAGLKIIAAPLKKMLGKNMATKVMSKIGGLYGTELATETVTQMGQNNVEAQIDKEREARSFTDPAAYWESLKEVAPQVFILTTLMGGAGAVGTKVYQKKVSDPRMSTAYQQAAADPAQLMTIPDTQLAQFIENGQDLVGRRKNDEGLKEALIAMKGEQQRRETAALDAQENEARALDPGFFGDTSGIQVEEGEDITAQPLPAEPFPAAEGIDVAEFDGGFIGPTQEAEPFPGVEGIGVQEEPDAYSPYPEVAPFPGTEGIDVTEEIPATPLQVMARKFKERLAGRGEQIDIAQVPRETDEGPVEALGPLEGEPEEIRPLSGQPYTTYGRAETVQKIRKLDNYDIVEKDGGFVLAKRPAEGAEAAPEPETAPAPEPVAPTPEPAPEPVTPTPEPTPETPPEAAAPEPVPAPVVPPSAEPPESEPDTPQPEGAAPAPQGEAPPSIEGLPENLPGRQAGGMPEGQELPPLPPKAEPVDRAPEDDIPGFLKPDENYPLPGRNERPDDQPIGGTPAPGSNLDNQPKPPTKPEGDQEVTPDSEPVGGEVPPTQTEPEKPVSQMTPKERMQARLRNKAKVAAEVKKRGFKMADPEGKEEAAKVRKEMGLDDNYDRIETQEDVEPSEFTPTHELPDGTPVRKVEGDEDNIYIDADGQEYVEPDAKPVAKAGPIEFKRSDNEALDKPIAGKDLDGVVIVDDFEDPDLGKGRIETPASTLLASAKKRLDVLNQLGDCLSK